MAAWSKLRVCSHSFAGIACSIPTGVMGVSFERFVLFCQVEISSFGWSLV